MIQFILFLLPNSLGNSFICLINLIHCKSDQIEENITCDVSCIQTVAYSSMCKTIEIINIYENN